jgi:hypothetical protein
MSFTKASLAATALTLTSAAAAVGSACTTERRTEGAFLQSTAARFHDDVAFPAVPPPECNATVSCSAIAYEHEPKTCADLELSGLVAKTVPLRYGTSVVVALSAGEQITLTSSQRVLVRPDGGETVYYSWSFHSTTPVVGMILRGDPITQPDAIVYRFDPSATTGTGLQGSWIAWVCGEGRFDDSCLYPFDPVEGEICYRAAAPVDAGDDRDGGKTW